MNHYLYFFKHNLAARFLGKKRPLLCGFKITHRCNLKCRICPFWKMEGRDISFETAVKMMDQMYSDGIRLMIFEGGEPFMWKDGKRGLEDLVKESKKRFFCTGITTNGTLPIETGADVVWVSIDGLKESHDKGRGESFDYIISGIKMSSHPKIFANVCISKLNHRDIPGLVKALKGIVKGITIQFYYPFPDSEDQELALPEREAVIDELLALKRKGYPLMDSTGVLKGLKKNTWRCHPWLIASAEPDGSVNYGCYLKDRAEIACEKCGFAAHAEISKAYDWSPGAIAAGAKIFGFKMF